MVKNLPANLGDIRDPGSILRSRRSPGEGHDNPFQDSCLENPHGQKSLVGYSSRGCKESDMTEWLTLSLSLPLVLPGKPHIYNTLYKGFPGGSVGKESTCTAGDLGLIPGLGRCPGEGNNYPFQYSGLENPMDCIVHGVTKSQIGLRDFHFHFRGQ